VLLLRNMRPQWKSFIGVDSMKQILRDSRTVESRWEIPTDQRIEMKKARYDMLNVILSEYEKLEYDDQDREYIKDLKHRISKTRSQLRNMGIDLLSDA
jgi:hypothetical protein